MLDPAHVETINRARALLKHLEEETMNNVSFQHGKFGEACEAAERALFNVLILARHWMNAEISDAEIHGKRKET